VSAAYAAREDCAVTLLERSSTLGGRGITNKLGDFEFNLGPHAVYKKGALARALRELDVPYRGSVPANTGYAIKEGTLHDVGLNPKWFLTSRLIGSRTELLKIFMRIRSMDTSKYAGTPIGTWLETEVRDPGVRALITGLLRVSTYANDPALDAGIALGQLQMGQAGVLYLDHGWQTIVDGLAAAATRTGALIETSASAEAIERRGERHSVHLKDGRTIEGDALVLAVTPDIAAALTAAAPLQRVYKSAVPVRAACLDVGLRRLTFPKRQFAFGLDTPLYFSVHTRAADLAPKGQAVIHVAKYLAPDDSDAKAHEQELQAVMDLVQPGWRDELGQKRYLPNMTVVPATARAQDGGLTGRPAVDGSDVDGVFLAGDWIGAEGWLSDASAASGKQAARLAIERAREARRMAPERVAASA
jgi:phytoene dehydrogenase-like protein